MQKVKTIEEVENILRNEFKDEFKFLELNLPEGSLGIEFLIGTKYFEITYDRAEGFSLKVFECGGKTGFMYSRIIKYKSNDVEEFVKCVKSLADIYNNPSIEWV